MNIAYCSLLLPEDKNIAERSKGHLAGVSLHKFSRAIIQGLDANLNEPVKVFNIINTLNYPNFPQLFFQTEKWNHAPGSEDVHVGYINLFGIKYMTQERGLYKQLDAWMKTCNGEKCVVCVHHNYYPMMKAALRIKKKYGDKVVTCLISGDIPGKFGLKSQYKENLKQKLIERMNVRILQMAKGFESFVLQTKYMAEGFEVQEKPVCVLECMYSPPDYQPNSDRRNEYAVPDKKIIFYAGSLRREYDALHLVRAFMMLEGDEYELWLAGGGNAVEEIKEMAKQDGRIRYLAFISPQEVAERQAAATVLISPRTSDHVFVKYSFPSKTMECLASGKPYIAHRLPCEPDEYADYIQYPKDESDQALADKIAEICSLTNDQRHSIGEKGKQFILEQKNPKEMCKRIVSFWDSLLKG